MNSTTRSILIWGGVILGIGLLFTFLVKAGTKPSGPTVAAELKTPVSQDDHIKGNPDASITIVEYSDFQCPACAAAYPTMKRLVDEYPNDVRVVYRHFPLRQIHPHAQLAAQASEAAAKQGKFWEMHDMLFNTQQQWSGDRNAKDHFIQLAESLGLNKDQFIADLESSEAKEKVNKDYASGASMNIPGTPTFFFNGTQIQTPPSYESFKQLIQNELSA